MSMIDEYTLKHEKVKEIVTEKMGEAKVKSYSLNKDKELVEVTFVYPGWESRNFMRFG